MKEKNEYFLEGLPNIDKEKTSVEDEKRDEENGPEGVFIHDIDELQKSMLMNRTTFLTRQKAKLNNEDNIIELQKKKPQQIEEEKDNEVDDDDDLELLPKEQDEEVSYLKLDQLLGLEDPFMRLSRPSGLNKTVFFPGRKRIKQKKKKKQKFLFKQKPKDKDISTKNEDESRADKSEIKLKKGEKSEEEDEDDDEDEFINVNRTSFLSRDSAFFEWNNEFEVEVVDSVWMTVLQILNCMIKANLVQIAISMKELGLIWGPITICLIAIMSLISLNLILEVNKMTGQRSYLIFSEMLFGHLGSIFVLLCQFMSAFGGCLSYIVIFNKVVPKILSFSISNQYISDEKICSSVLAAFLLFYCYKQDVNIIKTAAKYAVFAILLFVVLTIIDFIVAIFSNDRLISINNKWNSGTTYDILYGLNCEKYQENRIANIITAVACIILSYSFHVYTFSIYGCMGKISRKQFFITTSVSVLLTTIIYLICGTIGYLLYYDTLTDSILDAIQESWLNSLLSLANVINVIMTFPISFAAVKKYFLLFIGIIVTLLRDFFLWAFQCLPKVHTFRGRISKVRISKVFRKENDTLLMSGKQLVKLPKFLEIILGFFIYAVIFWVASMYTQLKIIFSITGGVMGNILSFIFPSIFYLYLSEKKVFSKYGIVAVFFVIFGFVTMGICITSTIQNI